MRTPVTTLFIFTGLIATAASAEPPDGPLPFTAPTTTWEEASEVEESIDTHHTRSSTTPSGVSAADTFADRFAFSLEGSLLRWEVLPRANKRAVVRLDFHPAQRCEQVVEDFRRPQPTLRPRVVTLGTIVIGPEVRKLEQGTVALGVAPEADVKGRLGAIVLRDVNEPLPQKRTTTHPVLTCFELTTVPVD